MSFSAVSSITQPFFSVDIFLLFFLFSLCNFAGMISSLFMAAKKLPLFLEEKTAKENRAL